MSQKEKNNLSETVRLATYALLVLLWAVLAFHSYEFLYKVDEKSLFLYDSQWFTEFLGKPGGFLEWCGLFLTQFMHIPWLGALLWVLLLWASAILAQNIIGLGRKYSVIALIPSSLLVAYSMSLGYLVYIVNSPGFFFTPLLGYLWTLLSVYMVRKTSRLSTLIILIPIWGLTGYYLTGFYSFAGLIAAGVDLSLSDRNKNQRLIPWGAIAATILLAPILFYGFTTYPISEGWVIGLPSTLYSETIAGIRLPIILALSFLPIISVVKKYLKETSATIKVLAQCAALTLSVVIPAVYWFDDANFRTELGMIRATDNMDWNKVVQLMGNHSQKDSKYEPTRVMVVLKDLALIKTNQEGDLAFGFEDGSKEQKKSHDIPMVLQIGRTLYLNYGIPGLAHRWCMEETGELGWSNSTLKYLAMTAISLGNYQLAQKYLGKLDRTLFYRKWAREQIRLCQNPELVATTAPYDQIIPLMCYQDRLQDDINGPESFLSRHFSFESPQKSTPLYDRVALFFSMKTFDSTLFWTRFFMYLESNNPAKICRYYQEAAYLHSITGQRDLLDALPFDKTTIDLYNAFISKAVKQGDISRDDAHRLFPANLRHTYFYYYFYMRNLELF